MGATMRTSRELDDLYRLITTEGMCVGSGPDDDRWLPEVAPPRTLSRRRQLERHALHVCTGCPVMAECGTWALGTGQAYGIWGGMAQHQLAEARPRSARGRKPAAARLASAA